MASSNSIIQLILFSFFISISFCLARTSSKSQALILPVSKDAATLQYVTQINMGTPPAKKSFVVDVGGQHLWMGCDHGSYVSSTIKQSLCGSSACSVAKAGCHGGCLPGIHRPGCNKERCSVLADNTIPANGSGFALGFVSLDKIALHSTDGSKSGPSVTISDFIFGCLDTRERLANLAPGADGMIGLGRAPIALPTQLSSAFGGSLRRKFAICLPSTSKPNGVMFFGDSPYVFYPSYNTSISEDVSSRFKHTRLYINTLAGASIRGPYSSEYFVKVTSILVDRKPISINSRFLEFHSNGKGGAKISTVEPYTKLETTIYKSLVKEFDKALVAAHNASKVSPVAPFTDCYKISLVSMTLVGLAVPDIALEFENNKNVQWEVYGYNSMVEVSRDVACLAFLDAGDEHVVTTPIVIGAHQMEDNLLQFDVAANRFAFTSTLLSPAIKCSNFRF